MTNRSDQILPNTPETLQWDIPEDLAGLGDGMAAAITRSLGDKLFFSILSTGNKDLTAMGDFREHLIDLSHVNSFDINTYSYYFESASRKIASNECNLALQRHTTSLHRGTALVFDEDAQQGNWVTIPKRFRQRFADNIQNIAVPQIENQDEYIHDDDESAIDLEKLVRTMTLVFAEKVVPLIRDIPDMRDILMGDVNGITVSQAHDLNGTPILGISAGADSKTLSGIRKKVKNFCNLVEEFAANPEKIAAEWQLKNDEEQVKNQAREFADSSVMEQNTELYNSLTPEERKEIKERHTEDAPKLTKRQERHVKQLAQIAAEESGVTKPEELYDIELVNTIGNVDISLPWINHGTKRTMDIHEFRVGECVTYIVHGIEDKLQTIADETLDKEELANKITSSIEHQARLINGGSMPWTQSSNPKPVDKNGKAPAEYKNESIWYTYDLRPNAPRVYFIVKDAKDIEVSNQKLQSDAKCVVIIGITDKSKQLDVLKRFTGKSRSELVAGGAGSI